MIREFCAIHAPMSAGHHRGSLPVTRPMMRQGFFRHIRKAGWRLYEELILPDRQHAYRQLLQLAKDQGYRVIDNAQWLTLQTEGTTDPTERILVMRHDIDTDPTLALVWHQIEQSLDCRASYYFRQSTMNADVIRQLAQAGVHVSYHFEELADYAKQHRLRTPAAVQTAMPAIQAMFAEKLADFRKRFNLPADIVCSHGDWMNRHLRMPNHTLLQDQTLRQQLGIRSECYDDNVMTPFSCYLSDSNPPHYWVRGEPLALIREGVTPLGILTHPKSWRAHWPSNLSELTCRIREALRFRFGKGWT